MYLAASLLNIWRVTWLSSAVALSAADQGVSSLGEVTYSVLDTSPCEGGVGGEEGGSGSGLRLASEIPIISFNM